MANTFDEMSDLYDLMVPWESRLAREKPFYEKIFKEPPRKILDAACGTGRHALLFHEMGHEVTGTDLSESALAIARTHAAQKGALIPFITGDLRKPADSLVPGSFDFVTVLGNSLAQFFSEDDMASILGGIARLLAPGGAVLFQMLNFHSCTTRNERFSPLRVAEREGRDILFQKFFDIDDNGVILNLFIFFKEEEKWTRTIQSTPLRPWRKEDLERLLREKGFETTTFYGDFASAPFNAGLSKDIIGLAHVGK
jgi:glycine/sarcosine N-methyltransferase